MDNKNTITLAGAVAKYDSVEATITGPLDASNGKQYYKAQFERNTAQDGGYIAQSKDYTKLFFEDTHSRLFKAAQKCQDDGTPMKILAGRIQVPTDKAYYILDENGERRKKKDGNFVTANVITMFLIADENPIAEFNRRCNQITANDAWVKETLPEGEEEDPEETKEQNLKSGKPGSKK